jgi:hypothetical protein
MKSTRVAQSSCRLLSGSRRCGPLQKLDPEQSLKFLHLHRKRLPARVGSAIASSSIRSACQGAPTLVGKHKAIASLASDETDR